MATPLPSFDPERIGRRRLPDNKTYRASLNANSSAILSSLQDLLPSNYPESTSTELAKFYRSIARESVRQNDSMNFISNDKVFSQTRIQYLQQILGERLFLDQQLVPVSKDDTTYRKFLIALKDAYLSGSKKSVIEGLINTFTDLKVNIKELFREARKPNSAYGLTDTNKMLVELFIDDIASNGNVIGNLINSMVGQQSLADVDSELAYFVNLVKPAHVLYDTKLIWTEQIDVNKVHDLLFGDLGGGCVPHYITTPFNEKVVLATQIRLVPSSTIGADIYTIGTIHPEDLILFTTDYTKIYVEPGPGTGGTTLFGLSGRRILFSDLHIGQTIQLVYVVIPGEFNFYYPPPDIFSNYESRFYRNIYRKGAFQSFVKKQMDSKGRFPLQISSTPTTICDRWVEDIVQPLYEDLRKNCNQRTETDSTYNVTLAKHMWAPRFPLNGIDTSNERPILGDLFSFVLPYSIVAADEYGAELTPQNLVVLKDGTSLINSVASISFYPTTILLKNTAAYWDSSATTTKPPVIGDTLQFDYYADIIPYTPVLLPVQTSYIYGISDWQLPGAPISNGQGTNLLALPNDVQLYVDGTVIPNAVVDLEPVNGFVTVQDLQDFWLASPLGRAPTPYKSAIGIISTSNSSRTVVGVGTQFTVEIPIGSVLKKDSNEIGVVQSITNDAILNLASVATSTYSNVPYGYGDVFSFSYYKSGAAKYAALMDDPSRDLDDDMVFDGNERDPVPEEQPLQYNYKFRADLLHHASVLNSPDTLLLNNYQKPSKRASIANRQDSLNHYNYFFSPEHLLDTDKDIVLNDAYLDKDIPAAVTLNAGTPTFQQTFGYQPGLINQKKLTDTRKNHSLLMYSDLLLKKDSTGSSEITLSSICDNESPHIGIQYKEPLEEISECSDWILFDSAETRTEQVSIPGEYEPVPNLRVPGEDLRDNFVLRDLAPTGLATAHYNFMELDNIQNSYQLPDTTRVSIDSIMVNFPALPVMHDATTLATVADVIVSIDGVEKPGIIQSFDASTGAISLYPQVDGITIEQITLTAENITSRSVKLNKWPLDPFNVALSIDGGPAQVYITDYIVLEDALYFERPLNRILSVGDKITISYESSGLINRQMQFEYHILSTGNVTLVDTENSRVFDNDDVFPYFCYDGYEKSAHLKYTEYINYLNDSGKGIKQTYFNKDTLQLEEHVYSGPIFELYDVNEDEISSPDSFPDALVRVMEPLSQPNPLRILPNYDFLDAEAVRIRKKTIKELLPDRTFKTTMLYEALPV